jgi:hypothetical protein
MLTRSKSHAVADGGMPMDHEGDAQEGVTPQESEHERKQVTAGLQKRKRRKAQSRKTIGQESAKLAPETGTDAEGVDKMPTSLQRGDDAYPVAGTGGLELLVPWSVVMEAMATETAFEEPKESFMKLLLEMQSKDSAVTKWQ